MTAPAPCTTTTRRCVHPLLHCETVSSYQARRQTLELEKQRNLAGKQHHSASAPHEEHAPGWNEALASESEAHVKVRRRCPRAPAAPAGPARHAVAHAPLQADKASATPDEMIRTTVEYVKKRHGEELPAEANYAKDEIEGPLKSAASTAAEVVSNVLEQTGLKGKQKQ